MKYFSIVNTEGEKISENLEKECRACIESCTSPGKLIDICPKFKDQRRQGIIKNNKGVTFLCCDKTKTTKLFRDKLEGLSYAYYDLLIPKEKYEFDAKVAEQTRVNRLVHNLTSINAHNIQEIYDLVPQEILSSNYQTQLDFVQSEIKRDVRKAALMFLRIAKHNIHMKTEFSIYRKLERSDSNIELRPHSIQKVLMNVLHTFFIDFTNNGILVEVDNYFGKVLMDYETIQVALYHLIENASKYTKPNSKIKIQFTESEAILEVQFNMTSIFIEEDEADKIFTEGYSGKEARNCEINGDGIGMWRIKQMMLLNKGDIEILRGSPKVISDGRGYAFNKIVLKFRKKQ